MIGWIAVGETNPGYFKHYFIRQRGLSKCRLGQSSRHLGFEFIVEFDTPFSNQNRQFLNTDWRQPQLVVSSPMASATRFFSFSGAPTFQIQM